jgi:hypothetical protein
LCALQNGETVGRRRGSEIPIAVPVVLEFDHLRDRKFMIATGIRNRNWNDVLDEIAKCAVVCANCHRRRTAERGGFIRAAVAQR